MWVLLIMNKVKDVLIRDAGSEDVPQMAVLMTELGYPTSTDQMAERFAMISRLPDYRTLVAEKGGQLAGMAGMTRGVYYEHDGVYVRIVAFIVKKDFRKLGIGGLLLAACEKWAANLGSSALLLTSGNRPEREEAYTFYQHHGFTITSSGFVKPLRGH